VKKIKHAFANREPLKKKILSLFGQIPPEKEFNKELFEQSITQRFHRILKGNNLVDEERIFENEEEILREVQKSREQLKRIKIKEAEAFEQALKMEQKNQAISQFNGFVDSINQRLGILHHNRFYFNGDENDLTSLDRAQKKCLSMIESFSDPLKEPIYKEEARIAALEAIESTIGIPRNVKIVWAEEKIEKITERMEALIEEYFKLNSNGLSKESTMEREIDNFEAELKKTNLAYSLLTKLTKDQVPFSLEIQGEALFKMRNYLGELEEQVSFARTALEEKNKEIDRTQFYFSPHKVDHQVETIDVGEFIPENLFSIIDQANSNLEKVSIEFLNLKSSLNSDEELRGLLNEAKYRLQVLDKHRSNLAFYHSERYKQIETNIELFLNER
jgi:hypothetical protein